MTLAALMLICGSSDSAASAAGIDHDVAQRGGRFWFDVYVL